MSGFFSRFLTSAFGGAKVVGDAIMEIDAVADAELIGSIDKMESDRDKANEAYIGLVAETNRIKREINELNSKIELTVNAARKALANQDQGRAQEFASQADTFKQELELKKTELVQYEQGVEKQKINIEKINKNISIVQRESKMLKAEKAVVNASKVASASVVGSSNGDSQNALAILERQKNKVRKEKDLLAASESILQESTPINASEYLNSDKKSDTLALLMAESDSSNN